jgi:RNA polymerase sigma factor (sigma-70 family)
MGLTTLLMSRPSRGDVERATVALIARHGAEILATARRYSAAADDAEDAYQRGLEILLTKAPTTREEELVPWLKTVVKHEAFAIRRQRERSTPVADDGRLAEPPTVEAAIHEQAERYERLRMGAEALGRLKPQEVRCLLLKAEGLSYKEICEVTGFSYTKVNRCLTEGRQSFRERVAGIESGAECGQLEPLLSRLADGEADAREAIALRRHLRGCPACRATFREYRSAPERLAALLPLAAVAGDGDVPGFLSRALESIAALAQKASSAGEAVSAQKAAAVAASTAALAGGGAATVSLREGGNPVRSPTSREATARAVPRTAPPVALVRPPTPRPGPPARSNADRAPERTRVPAAQPTAAEAEFGPAGTSPAAPAEAGASRSSGGADRSPTRSRPAPSGAAEFAP